jgi:hypothetical protein
VDEGAEAHPKRMIDWTALNLAASIALLCALLHIEEWILPAIPPAVWTNTDHLTWFIAERTLSYGLPFAAVFLVIRSLDLAAALRAAPIVAWILFLCSILLHVDRFNEAFVLHLIYNETWLRAYYPYIPPVPLEVRLAALLGVLGAWLWVICGFVGTLLSSRAALQWPSRSDIAVAFIAGVALPAAALAPLLPVAINYRDLYAAQETRFRELCKGIKTEILAAPSAPKSVFVDPNESLSCWSPSGGQCRWLSKADRLAQLLVIQWQLDFAELWDHAERAKPPVLKRCDHRDNCQTIEAVTAKYRVLTREVQSKADEALGLHVPVITVDERETGDVIGRLQFVYSFETHRFCAPATEIHRRGDGDEFESSEFIVRALGVEPRKWPR